MRNQLLSLFFFLLLLGACQPTGQPDSVVVADRLLEWAFPLPRVHTGMLIGNGTQGLMIWGDSALMITVGRNGFWDRRGGNPVIAHTSFQDVKRLLYANDEKGLRKAFGLDEGIGALAARPHQIGGADVRLPLPAGWKLEKGTLDLSTATAEVHLKGPGLAAATIRIWQSVQEEVAVVEWPDALPFPDTELIPSWDYIEQTLAQAGVQPPTRWQGEHPLVKGFCQYLPEDEPLAMQLLVAGESRLLIGTLVGEGAEKQVAANMAAFSPEKAREQSVEWWKQYWAEVPSLSLPDPLLQELYEYGLYKQAACTPPQGVACSLQGPFMEAYQLPPWSADYHFNINAQMIYLPSLATNRAAHLWPLWNMILSWMPDMQRNGEAFFGRKGALMMPHAVDDKGQVVGAFWTGTIDHACTAWMGQLAWQHYRYASDRKVLEQVAWPLLNGAFEGYFAMLEEIADGKGGKRYSLPVSVSPEFKGSRMDAWGRDASFQLAALHLTCQLLAQAAPLMGQPLDPRWADVAARLPAYASANRPATLENPERLQERILLWEGMDLIESHRHHSHLAGIYPFMTVNPADSAHQQIVRHSIRHLTNMGPGRWSGWCVPWASVLHARVGQPESAVSWLHWWHANFVNEGRGTLHDAAFHGGSLLASKQYDLPEGRTAREVMQLDAGFGALSAVLELLVQHRPDGIYVCPDIHRDWKGPFFFENIGAEGGFRISASMNERKVQQVRIQATADGPLHLWHGLGPRWTLNGKLMEGEWLIYDAKAGEELLLARAD